MNDRKKAARVAFTVPPFDAQVLEWIKNQRNISVSIRLLIKTHISKYGMTDVTALPVMIDETVQIPSINQESVQSVQISETADNASEIRQESAAEIAAESVPVLDFMAAPAPEPVQTEPDIKHAVVPPKVNSMLEDLMK